MILGPAGAEASLHGAESHGATVFTVRGSFEDCRRLEHELEHLFPWGFLDGNLRPFAVEGVKTIAYEIAEQLGWEAPDAVVSPVASGTLFAKLAQGFAELDDLGLVRTAVRGCTAPSPSGCAPVAAAWADERPPSRVTPNTVARSLAVGDPSYGDLAIGAARMTGGAISAVSEELIESSTVLLAENSGVEADPAGGVAFAALVDLVRSGSDRPRGASRARGQRGCSGPRGRAVHRARDRARRRRLPGRPRRRPRLAG